MSRIIALRPLAAMFLSAARCLHAAEAPSLHHQPLFTAGQEGYASYRIPSIVRTGSGALLAFCEGRKTSAADHGDIDIVMRRSTDHGETWSPRAVVQEEGDTASIAIGNPVPVLDESTGHIHLLFCRNNDRVFHSVSTDDGLTWSGRREITASVKLEEWGWYATGPVHGVQLKRGAQSGRLVIPCDHRIGVDGSDSGPFGDHVIHSDDHGATWQLGAVAPTTATVAPNENTCVELLPPAAGGGSRLHFNARDHIGPHARATALSDDGGSTYSAAGFTDAPQFVCPTVQGALLRLRATDQGDASNRILFSCPNGSSRGRISIWSSNDEATTWSAPKPVFEGPSAYGDMAVTATGKVALLYEKGDSSAYETITLTRFNEAWLDAPSPPAENPGSAFWNLEETAPGGTCPTTAGAILDVHPDEHALHLTSQLPFSAVAGAPAFGNGKALALAGNGGLRIFDSDSANRFDYGPGHSFTIEVVCRIPSGSTQIGALVAKDVGATSPSWWLRVEGGKARFLVSDNATERVFSSSASINDGTWHHIAAVRDASNPSDKKLRLYIDGQLSGSIADTTTGSFANGNSLWIGRFNAASRLLTGDIDLVRITSAALAPGQFVSSKTQLDADADRIPDAFERESTGSLAPMGTGDSDGDRNPDLLEYAFGGDPVTAGHLSPSVTPAVGHVQVETLQRPIPAWLVVQLWASNDMGNWFPADSEVSLEPVVSGLWLRKDHVGLAPDRMFFRYSVADAP